MLLKVKYLEEGLSKLKIPDRDDVGIDLFSSEDREVYHQREALISTGIAIQVPEGYWAQIIDRSSKSKYYHVMAGVIDSTYRGELKVRIYAHSFTDYGTPGNDLYSDFPTLMVPIGPKPGWSVPAKAPYVHIKKGEKIGQLIIHKNYNKLFEIVETDTLSDTERGDKGFGSTGG